MGREVVIIDGVRTPQGLFGGSLRTVPAQQLGRTVVRALVERARIDPAAINEVIFGCVGQYSDAPNIARVIALLAGIPKAVPGFTVQRNCASGLQAIVNGYQSIQVGDSDVIVAGGTESMSMAPFVNRDLRFGKFLRHSTMIDAVWEGLTDPICGQLMGLTAENLVEEFKITREEQDKFAVLSHSRAFRATREGRFKDEIIPVTVEKKARGKPVPPETITQDEGPNIGLTEQLLAQYPTVFKEHGTVTPGNACTNADGAACVLMMSSERAKSLGLAPLGYVRAYGFAGLEPERMGLGPTLAVPVALKRAGLQLSDIQLIEENEAFAAQYLAVARVLKFNREITNVNGGAIALGHPVGASGTRLVVTLLHEMKRRNLSLGLAMLCVGGGQGAALIVERK
ncbi:MAG: thiolase family protein [Candidatus Omnitrophica bacterium]|nr:thiolase family protein [Candidatus Omnitrophota bacterium]